MVKLRVPMIRILQPTDRKDIRQIMQDMRVDPYGIEIMLPKATTHLIRINSISNIAANILKQEMLSLGGDVAIARDALTGKTKTTDCLLMGNVSQFNRLNQKLHKQPFGLNNLSEDLSSTVKNYQRDKFMLRLGNFSLNLGARTHIMGIVNITPDSFSGDGLYSASRIADSVSSIVDFAQGMLKDGADIIDIGGESTHPGAKPVSVKEELSRTIPVIKALAKGAKAPISIDTYKPKVAERALDNGAVIVNDVTGLRNPRMAGVIARYKAGVVIMHMKGTPQTMQNNIEYDSLIDEILQYLDKAIKEAQERGIDKDRIIIDPGIGFAKTLEHNLQILRCLKDFKVLGKPILVGTSRKSFIGKILNTEADTRLFGTVASCVLAAQNGASIVRVHDVKEVKQALKITDSINK